MFAEDIGPQSRKLVQMLAVVVNGLHRLDAICPPSRISPVGTRAMAWSTLIIKRSA